VLLALHSARTPLHVAFILRHYDMLSMCIQVTNVHIVQMCAMKATYGKLQYTC
jgi:hypothetical protein